MRVQRLLLLFLLCIFALSTLTVEARFTRSTRLKIAEKQARESSKWSETPQQPPHFSVQDTLTCSCNLLAACENQDFTTNNMAPDTLNCSCNNLTLCQSNIYSLLNPNPCAADAVIDYNQGLHIAAVFIVLVASLLGSTIPLMAKYQPMFALDPFIIILGKCMGMGVVLACSLIHMLQPASQSLVSPCLPWEFNTDYQAYAFLFAMIMALLMHCFEFVVEEYMIFNLLNPKSGAHGHAHGNGHSQPHAAHGHDHSSHTTGGTIKSPSSSLELQTVSSNADLTDGRGENCRDDLVTVVIPVVDSSKTTTSPSTHNDTVSYHSHDGHVHSLLLVEGARKNIAAYLLEFGITVHSIFIGLQNGVVDEAELKTLLVALCFHQFFEGVALGARLVDATLSHCTEALFAVVFSLAAPLGLMAGILVTETINPNGETYLFAEGILDSCCAGILMYIAFVLLLKDFPADAKRYCHGRPNRVFRTCCMFGATWVGAGLMAFIGKYL